MQTDSDFLRVPTCECASHGTAVKFWPNPSQPGSAKGPAAPGRSPALPGSPGKESPKPHFPGSIPSYSGEHHPRDLLF